MILVANIVLLTVLTVLGVLFLMSYERPVAFVFAGLAWLAALVLVNFARFTDPYARPRAKRDGSRSAHTNSQKWSIMAHHGVSMAKRCSGHMAGFKDRPTRADSNKRCTTPARFAREAGRPCTLSIWWYLHLSDADLLAAVDGEFPEN